MTGSVRFRPNRPRVIGEVIDDEAILIDLETGSYFSLVGSGAHVWSAVERGDSVDELLASLAVACGELPTGAPDQVSAFLQELAGAELIVAFDVDPSTSSTSSAHGSADPTADTTVRSSAGPGRYEPPAVQRFDDMQELILLDPIHEVDEHEGWPRAKTQAPSLE
jgi:hypothetical protein